MSVVNKMGGLRTALTIVCIGAFGSALAQAGDINIYNTGIATDGTLLPGGGNDPHYSLVASADPSFGTGPASVAFNTTNFPLPAQWLQEDSNSISQWIAPRGEASLGNSVGTYDYQTSFDLTGFDATTAMLDGQWATDNGATIWLNGVDTGVVLDASTKQFTMWSQFSITSGFVQGLNTLDFLVNNTPNNSGKGPDPSGLRVELSGTAASTVPEPGTWVLLLSGLTATGLIRRRS